MAVLIYLHAGIDAKISPACFVLSDLLYCEPETLFSLHCVSVPLIVRIIVSRDKEFLGRDRHPACRSHGLRRVKQRMYYRLHTEVVDLLADTLKLARSFFAAVSLPSYFIAPRLTPATAAQRSPCPFKRVFTDHSRLRSAPQIKGGGRCDPPYGFTFLSRRWCRIRPIITGLS